jgi:RHH-type transcriptional regulator, rel operon repressor / antitoxin RelB
MSTQISIRTSDDLIRKFNLLAKETDRSRAYLINQALEEYIAREAWQVAEIRKAMEEAEAGDFATDEEVAALDAKWGYRKRKRPCIFRCKALIPLASPRGFEPLLSA